MPTNRIGTLLLRPRANPGMEMTHRQSDREPAHDRAASRARSGGGIPLGRVLTVACLVPVLAMIVLGASRFDAIRALDVDAVPLSQAGDTEGANQDTDQTILFDITSPFETVLAGPDAAAAETMLEREPGLPANLRILETRMMVVTAYCPCSKCCGKQARGITASGKPVTYDGGKFVAADTRVLPFGTLVRIPGYHQESPVEVIDRGGAIKGNKIDVFFKSHDRARTWGRQMLPVQILAPVDLSEADSLGGDR